MSRRILLGRREKKFHRFSLVIGRKVVHIPSMSDEEKAARGKKNSDEIR
jgi:hypothetical protein